MSVSFNPQVNLNSTNQEITSTANKITLDLVHASDLVYNRLSNDLETLQSDLAQLQAKGYTNLNQIENDPLFFQIATMLKKINADVISMYYSNNPIDQNIAENSTTFDAVESDLYNNLYGFGSLVDSAKEVDGPNGKDNLAQNLLMLFINNNPSALSQISQDIQNFISNPIG